MQSSEWWENSKMAKILMVHVSKDTILHFWSFDLWIPREPKARTLDLGLTRSTMHH